MTETTGPPWLSAAEIFRRVGIREIGLVRIVARNQDRADDLAARVRESGQDARVGTCADVGDAQLVICATPARVHDLRHVL